MITVLMQYLPLVNFLILIVGVVWAWFTAWINKNIELIRAELEGINHQLRTMNGRLLAIETWRDLHIDQEAEYRVMLDSRLKVIDARCFETLNMGHAK
jgi:hypothetical protein